MFNPCIIETTTATQAQADKIIHMLLQTRLAACVQCETIHSQYLWQGTTVNETEIRLSIKSAEHLFAKVQTTILTLHPYDCPQILQLPVTSASQDYRQWLSECLIQDE